MKLNTKNILSFVFTNLNLNTELHSYQFLPDSISKIEYFSILFFDRTLKLDDPVGAISAHGIVGILGVLVVPWTNSEASLLPQIVGVVSIAGFTFITSYIAISVINSVLPIRASDEEQYVGLDVSEIGVEAYPEFK